MTATLIILLAITTPFVGALLVALLHRYPTVRDTATLTIATLLLVLIISLYIIVEFDDLPVTQLFELLPGLTLGFALEPLGLAFALIASSLWLITSIYSIGYVRANSEPHQTRYFVCFSLSLGATIGLATAADLVTLFVFYEILTLATYPLVIHSGTPSALRAGRTYLGVLLGTSIALLLPAIVMTWAETGTVTFTVGGIFDSKPIPTVGIILAMFVFGSGKAALIPFHFWLPAAMVAPAPVSALLHAVAVVKAGVFVILKVAIYIFGTETLSAIWSVRVLSWIAAFTIVGAALIALREDDLKRRLAYSTISQLAYITLGALLVSRAGLIGGGMHMITHAFGKITLFFCAGSIYTATQLTKVSEMRGLAHRMPITMAAFAIGSLSVVGLPPLAGMWSKWYLAKGTIDSSEMGLLLFLLVGSLLSAGYLLPVAISAYLPLQTSSHSADSKNTEGPGICSFAIGITASACLFLFLFPNSLFRLISQIP